MRSVLEAASMIKGKMADVLPITIQKYLPMGKEHASVLFTVGFGSGTPVAPEEAKVADAITRLYSGRVRTIPGSVKRVADGPRDVFRAVVGLNRPSVPYETASSDGWTSVASNLFSDADDALWEVSGENDSRVLRRIGSDDLQAVLDERRSRSMATAVAAVSLPSVNKHDAVLFFDTASEESRFGIAVSPTEVFVQSDDGKTSQLKKIEAAAVLAVVPHDLDAPQFRNPPEEAASKSFILEYYRKLYGQNSEFYAKLKKLIEEFVDI